MRTKLELKLKESGENMNSVSFLIAVRRYQFRKRGII